MPSSFGQYQNGIAPVSGISEAGANIGRTYMAGVSALGQGLAEGIKAYSNAQQEREMLQGKIEGLAGTAQKLVEYAKLSPENQAFVDAKSGKIAELLSQAKDAPNMSLGKLRGLASQAELGLNSFGQEFQMFNMAKTENNNKYIANVGLNETENQLTTLAGQLKDDPNQQDLYKSVQSRLEQLKDVKTKPTVAQGAFLTSTADFLKALPTTLAIGEKLRTETGLARVGKALNEVNATPNSKLSPVEIEGISKFYDATKTAYENNVAIDNMLNQFRQTHNIPVSNQKIISQVFANIRDNAKSTKTSQGSALAESLDTYLNGMPQNLKEEGNVPAGSGFTTTDTSVPANVNVKPEDSKKFAESLAIPQVGVLEKKEIPLTEEERKTAVLSKVAKEYGVAPAEFNAWYNTLNPPKPSASIQKIGDATVVITTDTKGNMKFQNIPQTKPVDAFKTAKEKSEYNATTFGNMNPTTGTKEYQDAEGKPIWQDVGKDADLQISGRMQNVSDVQVQLFRQQVVSYSELMTQFNDLIELKKNYSVLASKGQAPEDSEMEKRINTELGIMKSRLQRVLYPTGQPRAWENQNVIQIMPQLTALFTYDSTQLGGLEELKIRLKNAIEEDAKGYGLSVRDKPKENTPKTPEQIAELARQVAIEQQVKNQLSPSVK